MGLVDRADVVGRDAQPRLPAARPGPHRGRAARLLLAARGRRGRGGLLQPRRLVRPRALPQPGRADAVRAAVAEAVHLHRPVSERQRRRAQPAAPLRGHRHHVRDGAERARRPAARAARHHRPRLRARPAGRRRAPDLRRPPPRVGDDPPGAAPRRRRAATSCSAATGARVCRSSRRCCTPATPRCSRRWLVDLGSHLLLHHHVPFTLVELRHVGGTAPVGAVLRTSRPKMFKSGNRHPVPSRAIDDLYSELTLVAW